MSVETVFSKFFVKRGDAYVRLYWVYILVQLFVLRGLWKSLGPPFIFLFELFIRTGVQNRAATIVGVIFTILLSAAIGIPLSIYCLRFPVRIVIDTAKKTIRQRYILGFKEYTTKFNEITEIQLIQPISRLQLACVTLCLAEEHKRRWYPFGSQIYLLYGRNRNDMREVAKEMQRILDFDDSKLRIADPYFRR